MDVVFMVLHCQPLLLLWTLFIIWMYEFVLVPLNFRAFLFYLQVVIYPVCTDS